MHTNSAVFDSNNKEYIDTYIHDGITNKKQNTDRNQYNVVVIQQ